MNWSVSALLIGFALDLLLGDPHGFPHPVVWMGRLIALLESRFRRIFPHSPKGEQCAGGLPWLILVTVSWGLPFGLLFLLRKLSPWPALAAESIMCWQILAVKSLRDESMLVYDRLEHGTLQQAQKQVSMIVGRDTERLDDAGVTRAVVETVAENTSDGIAAPLLFMALGGAPLGFLYKAINTMDSMLGYVDPPYTHFGRIPAKADDAANFLPARLTALLMLAAGVLLGLDGREGWRIFRRDRRKHASPNSAQTEAMCAGLLGLQLAGDAWYGGVYHKKATIGDARRQICHGDIPLVCRLSALTAVLTLLLCCALRAITG